MNAPVEQRDVDEPDEDDKRNHAGAGESSPDVSRVLCEADVPRRNLERAAEHELPDEEKRHQPPDTRAPESFAKIVKRSARAWHCRTELAPYHPVADHDYERSDPTQHCLRSAERGHEQRDGDEWSDADHVGHVQRRRGQEAEAALELRVGYFRSSRFTHIARGLSWAAVSGARKSRLHNSCKLGTTPCPLRSVRSASARKRQSFS